MGHVSRRTFVAAGIATLAAAGTGWWLVGERGDDRRATGPEAEALRRLFDGSEGAAAVGRAYLASLPAGDRGVARRIPDDFVPAGADRDEFLRSAPRHQLADAARRASLGAALAGDVVVVRGWRLDRATARLCAAFADVA